MTERLLAHFFYPGFPNEFFIYVRDAEPSVSGTPPGNRHLVSRSEGRRDFAGAIPDGWTDADVMEDLTAGRSFMLPSGERGKQITYPPVEFSARIFSSPVLLRPAEIRRRLEVMR
ncbi:MAG: hypothetical protein ACREAC_15055 [Blastocatellia bacterium]